MLPGGWAVLTTAEVMFYRWEQVNSGRGFPGNTATSPSSWPLRMFRQRSLMARREDTPLYSQAGKKAKPENYHDMMNEPLNVKLSIFLLILNYLTIQSSRLTVFFLSFNRNNYLQWLPREVRFWKSKKDKLYDVHFYDDFSFLFSLAGGMQYQVFQTLICCWWWLIVHVDRALSLSRVWQFQVNQQKISFHTWPHPTTNNTSCRNQDT